ncbi:MAG: hypothetical protein AAF821_20575 [Cyanobacteria bacterium P01_D01_bin.156]
MVFRFNGFIYPEREDLWRGRIAELDIGEFTGETREQLIQILQETLTYRLGANREKSRQSVLKKVTPRNAKKAIIRVDDAPFDTVKLPVNGEFTAILYQRKGKWGGTIAEFDTSLFELDANFKSKQKVLWRLESSLKFSLFENQKNVLKEVNKEYQNPERVIVIVNFDENLSAAEIEELALATLLVTVAAISIPSLAIFASNCHTFVNDLFLLVGLFSIYGASRIIDQVLDDKNVSRKVRFGLFGGGYPIFCVVMSLISCGLLFFYPVQECLFSSKMNLIQARLASDISTFSPWLRTLYSLVGVSTFFKLMSIDEQGFWGNLLSGGLICSFWITKVFVWFPESSNELTFYTMIMTLIYIGCTIVVFIFEDA